MERQWSGRRPVLAGRAQPAEGTATARMHEKRTDFYVKQDTAAELRVREQDAAFQDRLRLAYERGEFPGQTGPILVLR